MYVLDILVYWATQLKGGFANPTLYTSGRHISLPQWTTPSSARYGPSACPNKSFGRSGSSLNRGTSRGIKARRVRVFFRLGLTCPFWGIDATVYEEQDVSFPKGCAMKNIIFIIAAVLLSACATPPDPRVVGYMQWNTENAARATRGEIKFSDFYAESFERGSALPGNPYLTIRMRTLSDLIPIARKYESGEITKEQFADVRRSAAANAQAANDGVQQAMQAQKQAADAQISQSNYQTMMVLRQMQPAPMPMPAAPITCNTYQSGPGLRTTCQ